MVEWLGSLKDIVNLVADSKTVLGGAAGGLALISVAGAMPRVGFIRALTFGFRSYFRTTYPLSVRKSEIQQLNELILSMEKGSYITVIGGKGNGKSCLIDTALNRQYGVTKISVSCFSYSIVYVTVYVKGMFCCYNRQNPGLIKI